MKLSRPQLQALAILADGPARISNATNPDASTVSWRTIQVLEAGGLAIDIAGYKAVLTDAGRQVAANPPPPPPIRYGHGTHACYTLDRCRCRPCRNAATAYETRRTKDIAYGRPRTVDAEPVRAHVRDLMCARRRGAHHAGVGLKQIAKVSGVAHGTLWRLMYGAPDRNGPSARVRTATAQRLLAVTHDDMADGATVNAGPTRRMLQAMVAGGWAKAELARIISGDVAAKSLQVARSRRVTVRTARTVKDLHDRWQAGEIVPRAPRRRHDHGPPSPFPATPGPPACEDCGADPLAGGRWCWDHYLEHRSAA